MTNEDFTDLEKQELKKLFREMYYIEETDEWITSAHDWDEKDAIIYIRAKAALEKILEKHNIALEYEEE